jgi:nucleotide-binding universal stress UspA family protein
MKVILAFVGGGDRDQIILQTALAAARPLSAHLDLLHVHVPAAEAARYSHTEFASGAALRNALDGLKTKAQTFSDLAAENVRKFCASAKIEMCDTPTAAGSVSARFREEKSNALDRLTFHARHSDLIVMGRARQTQGLAPHTLEHLVLNCGRPILVAANVAPQTLTDTVMVCWQESSYAARAVTAATPILAKARRVVFVSVAESDDGVTDALHDLARQFGWNGVSAEVRVVPPSGRRVAPALATAADDCGADLVVMGAYGHSRARELIFGSCTEAFIDHSDRPILLMH